MCSKKVTCILGIRFIPNFHYLERKTKIFTLKLDTIWEHHIKIHLISKYKNTLKIEQNPQ
jgi:hypothetical protein